MQDGRRGIRELKDRERFRNRTDRGAGQRQPSPGGHRPLLRCPPHAHVTLHTAHKCQPQRVAAALRVGPGLTPAAQTKMLPATWKPGWPTWAAGNSGVSGLGHRHNT